MEFRFKKSLGQNFFNNNSLAEKIVSIVLNTTASKELVTTKSNTTLLEIGPGNGAFTSIFYKMIEDIVCIEKDDSLIEKLQSQFPKAKIIHGDFLEYDVSDLKSYLKDKNQQAKDHEVQVLNNMLRVFGSLPYNVSKPIIYKCLQNSELFESLTFIIQKEVAERYIERSPDSNALALITQIYADPKIILKIPPDSFNPKPNVDSCLIRFTYNNNKDNIKNIIDLEKFIHVCFKLPRKTLRNNVKDYLDITQVGKISKWLNLRPQHISFEEYVEIWGIIQI